MKKIVISGYYGFENLGDEAVLEGIITLLGAAEVEITVLSARPEITSKRYGVKSIGRYSIIQILAALAEADLFISGGGSLLQDVTGSFSVPYYLSLAWLAKLQGVKTVYYAQGAGPLNKFWSRKLTALSLNRFNLLGVRDQGSYNLLKQIGVKQKLNLTVDPVFALADFEYNLHKKIKGKLEIGVAVRPWSADYISELAAGLNRFSAESSCKFLLFSFHKGSDEKTAVQLQKLLKAESELVKLPNQPNKALSFFSELDLFVGVRLHSLIFALLNQIPLLAISYDPKVTGLMADLDSLPCLEITELKAAQVTTALTELHEQRYQLRKKIKTYLKQQKQQANVFARMVLEVIS